MAPKAISTYTVWSKVNLSQQIWLGALWSKAIWSKAIWSKAIWLKAIWS